MPACFQLIDRNTGVAESLDVVDDKICDFLHTQPDDVKYAFNWYNTVGLMMAVGFSKEKILKELGDWPESVVLKKIVEFIFTNYEPVSFHSAR